MRIGLVVQANDLASAVDGVRSAAAEGFASAWLYQGFAFDAVGACSIAGRETPDIEVGTAVVPTYPRHPTALAAQALTAAQATDGRFSLGIGTSHQAVVEGMLGLSFDRPAAHMRTYLETLVPLLREGRVDHAGVRVRTGAPPSPPVPVLVAALGPVMLRTAGELADGTITWLTGPRTLAEHTVPTITSAAEAAGRAAPRVVACLHACVTDDVDDARGRIAGEIAFYDRLPSYRAMLDREGAAGPVDVSIVGDESTVAAAVGRLRDLGVTDFVAVPAGTPDEIARTRALLRDPSLTA